MGYYVYTLTPGQSVPEKMLLDCVANAGNEEVVLHRPAPGIEHDVVIECAHRPIDLMSVTWEEVGADACAASPPDDEELELRKNGE